MSDDRNYAPDFVSAETLAYRLDCSSSTIYKCVKQGLLPHPIKIGGLIRWDFEAVRQHLLAERQVIQDEADEFFEAL